MKKLIRLLKLAHAIEIGAYYAYDGHWKSTQLKTGDTTRMAIWLIQCEEEIHREFVAKVLRGLREKSNPVLDFTMKVIGTFIGAACYVSPKRASAFGAAIMEAMGSNIYNKLAEEAVDAGFQNLAMKFAEMAKTEERHERFFKSLKNDQVPLVVSDQRNQN